MGFDLGIDTPERERLTTLKRLSPTVLWDGKAKLRARFALPDESAVFAEAKNNGQTSEAMMLVYLVELDDHETNEQPVDPGAFPPVRS